VISFTLSTARNMAWRESSAMEGQAVMAGLSVRRS
jgi:hypothetical protein